MLDRVGDCRHYDEIAQALQQVFGKTARILPYLDDLVDDTENGRAVAGRQSVDDLVEQRIRGVTKKSRGEFIRDSVGTGAAEKLVEDAQGVAHRARAGADDQGQRERIEDYALGFAQLEEIVAEDFRRHQPKRVVMCA